MDRFKTAIGNPKTETAELEIKYHEAFGVSVSGYRNLAWPSQSRWQNSKILKPRTTTLSHKIIFSVTFPWPIWLKFSEVLNVRINIMQKKLSKNKKDIW